MSSNNETYSININNYAYYNDPMRPYEHYYALPMSYNITSPRYSSYPSYYYHSHELDDSAYGCSAPISTQTQNIQRVIPSYPKVRNTNTNYHHDNFDMDKHGLGHNGEKTRRFDDDLGFMNARTSGHVLLPDFFMANQRKNEKLKHSSSYNHRSHSRPRHLTEPKSKSSIALRTIGELITTSAEILKIKLNRISKNLHVEEAIGKEEQTTRSNEGKIRKVSGTCAFRHGVDSIDVTEKLCENASIELNNQEEFTERFVESNSNNSSFDLRLSDLFKKTLEYELNDAESVSAQSHSFSRLPRIDLQADKYETKSNELRKHKLWSQLPSVIESNRFKSMSKKEIEVQERWFEIFSSELTYLSNLEILRETIVKNCAKVLEADELYSIFSHRLDDIHDLSKKLIDSIETRIQNDVFVHNNFDLLDKVINEARFREAYVTYASEQFMHKENFDQLSKANKKLHDLISKLLADECLNGKDILSYVVAPIQRLSRYKLLVDALIKQLSDEDLILQGYKLSKDIDQILIEANRKAEKLKNQNEAKRIEPQLKFKTKSMSLPDTANKRELLYHTDLTAIKINDAQTSSSSKITYHLILFDDFLLISLKETKQDEQCYLVLELFEKERISAQVIDYDAPESTDKLSCFLILFIKASNVENSEDKKYCFICNKSIGENWCKKLNKRYPTRSSFVC